MTTYTLLREIADSWVLLLMFAFFIGAIVWAFRPGSTAVYEDVSAIPLRNDILLPDNGATAADKRAETGKDSARSASSTANPSARKGPVDV